MKAKFLSLLVYNIFLLLFKEEYAYVPVLFSLLYWSSAQTQKMGIRIAVCLGVVYAVST